MSGVPQGSVLGPFLFVVFINDLNDEFKVVSKMYADDTKLISTVEDSNKAQMLQEDLERAREWSKKWLLKFNTSKCMVMHYGSSNKLHRYQMTGEELSNTCKEKELGVVFSSDLKCKNHVFTCESKANSMLGMIRKTFSSLDSKLLRTLYISFVRPLIEFAVPVWCPSLKGDIETLERIQHRVTRLVKSLRKLPYEERLKRLKLTTLEERRRRGVKIQLF